MAIRNRMIRFLVTEAEEALLTDLARRAGLKSAGRYAAALARQKIAEDDAQGDTEASR